MRIKFAAMRWPVVAVCLISLLSACGGGSNSAALPPTLSSIEVTPPAPSIAKGTAQQFAATAVFSDASRSDVTQNVTWTSSDATVATISNVAGTNGHASSLKVGTTSITAALGGFTKAVVLTVTPATITQLQVTPVAASIAKGTSKQYTATAIFSDGTNQDVTDIASWTSSATGVATITNAAPGKGLAASPNSGGLGATTIGATFGGKNDSTTLNVTPAVLTQVQVTPAAPSIAKGSARQFTATAVFSDATTQNVTTTAVWSSSDTTVAGISNTSPAQGMATSPNTGNIGNSTIAAAFGGMGGSTTLTVTPAVVTQVQVTPATQSIPKGTTLQYTAMAVYSDASTQDVTGLATWSSATPAVATVSNAAGSQGLATSPNSGSLGSTTIGAAFSGVDGSAALSITAAVLSRVDITPADQSIPVGTTQQYAATAVFSDSTTQDVTQTATWTSSNPAVAQISNSGSSRGLAAGKTTGAATLSAVSSGVSGTTGLTVLPATLSSIQVTPASPKLANGLSRQLTATGIFSDGTSKEITTDVTWFSTNSAVATISNAADSAGIASSVAPGTTTAIAKQGSISGSTTLTVTSATLSSIAVTPSGVSIAKGTTQQYTAVGTFSDSTTMDLTDQVAWSSSNPAIATISAAAGSEGLAQGVDVGAVTISANSNTPAGNKTGTTGLTVTAAGLVSIDVTPASASVAAGNKQQYAATGTFTDGTTQDITTSVTWNTSDATIATVGANSGLASSRKIGAVSVTATDAVTHKTGSASLAVTAATLESIAVTPANASRPLGSSVQYAATATYSDLTTADVTAGATWSSSDESVALVSNATGSQGLATTNGAGQGVGTTTVAATLDGVSASTGLTVTNVALVSIAITPVNPSVAKGTTLQMAATGAYSDGTSQDLTTSVTWSSSASAVADVSNAGGSNGLLAANTQGTANLTATDPATLIAGHTTVTVTPAALTSIQLTPLHASLPSGFAMQYTATGIFSDSSQQDITTQVSWNSLDSSVAAISNAAGSKGRATGVAPGSTVIAASMGSVSGSTSLTVSSATLTGIAITPTTATIHSGLSSSTPHTQQYAAVANFSDGSSLSATTQVVWHSSSTASATIDANGLATAGNTPGTATITATKGSITSNSATLTVSLN